MLRLALRGLAPRATSLLTLAVLAATAAALATAPASDAAGLGASTVASARVVSISAVAAVSATYAASDVMAQVGSTGWRVKAIQRTVGSRVTGRYDGRTRSAVKRWQRAHDLRASGTTDRSTYRAMFPVAKTYRTGVQTIGYSLLGRPIRLRVVGEPDAADRVLVIGCLHGNECAGVPVLDRLARMKPPAGTAFFLVAHPNPDGRVARTRGNARGVDLNRNFPGWKRRGKPGYVYYAGRSALSEPETRAVRGLVAAVHPSAIITYHQAMDVVDYGGGRHALQAKYARQTRMTFTRLTRYRGSLATWAHDVHPSTAVMTVELPRKVSKGSVVRHQKAVTYFAAHL